MPCTEVIIAVIIITITVAHSTQHSLRYTLASDGLKYFFYLYLFYFIFLFQNKVSKVVAECEKGTHKDVCIVVKSVLAQSGVY